MEAWARPDLSIAMSFAALPKASGSGMSQSLHASTTAWGSAPVLSLLLQVLGSPEGVHSPCMTMPLLIQFSFSKMMGDPRGRAATAGQDICFQGLLMTRE